MTKIQQKLILVFVVAEAVVIGVSGLLLAVELGRDYTRQEVRQVEELLRQVQGAFEVELDGLRHSVTDWGRWDALYGYLATRDPAFLEANIPDNVLDNLELYCLLLVDLSGRPVVTRVGAPEESGMEDLLALIRPEGAMWTLEGTEAGRAGLAIAGGKPVLAAAHAVTTGDGTAPARGVLLMARQVSEPVLERIQKSSTLSVRLIVDPGPELAWLSDRPDRPYGFHPISRDRAEAGLVWPDVTGRHRAAVVVALDRSLHRQYLTTLGRLWLGLGGGRCPRWGFSSGFSSDNC